MKTRISVILLAIILPIFNSTQAGEKLSSTHQMVPVSNLKTDKHDNKTSSSTDSTPGIDKSHQRGKLLYENHCGICHDSNVHIRNRRKATSLTDITGWVTRWQQHLKLNWSETEIKDVVNYLNFQYYNYAR